MADALEPGVRLTKLLLGDVQVASVFMNHGHAENAPQVETDRDACNTAGERGGEGERKREVAHVDEVPGEGEHGFVGDGQPDDPEDEQKKDREISVVSDPGEDLLFHVSETFYSTRRREERGG